MTSTHNELVSLKLVQYMGAQNDFSIVNRLKRLKLTQNIFICSFGVD